MSISVQQDMILTVRNLRTYFYMPEGITRAVDGIDLELQAGKTLGLVGESGCGKSVTALSILRLIIPPGRIESGQTLLDGTDLMLLSNRAMRRVRGKQISMIFQEPMSSLNPVFTVGDQVMEAVRLHRNVDEDTGRDMTVDMFRRVGISDPEMRVDYYPHQLSGGMQQRVMIAMALICNPVVLIADEPTTALDVTIQAQILDLLRDLQRDLNMSIILITHDLAVVAETADRVAVMYAGKIVEYADVYELYEQPKHPYTVGLLHSLSYAGRPKEKLEAIPGQVPDPAHLPPGCSFWPRCSLKIEKCESLEPPLEEKSPGHSSACWVMK